MSSSFENAILLYDGECYFCTNYVEALRLKEAFPGISILNARENLDLVSKVEDIGAQINDGMVLIHEGNIHWGVDAITCLINDRHDMNKNFFLRLNDFVFSNKTVGARIYAVLVRLRRVYLFLKRVPLIGKS